MLQEQSLNSFTKIINEVKKVQKIVKNISQRCEFFFDIYLQFLEKGDSKISQYLFEVLEYKKQTTKVSQCRKVISCQDISFQCFTCCILGDSNILFCEECFQHGSHEGHNFKKSSLAGTCDCGDEDYVYPKDFCPNHQPHDQQFQVDEEETIVFVREIKFAFFLLRQLYLLTQQKGKDFFDLCEVYNSKLMKKLAQFNENSMISNKMTSMALLSPYEEYYPEVNYDSVSNKNILSFFWKMEKLSDKEGQKRKKLFLSLFKINQFKEKLLLSFLQSLYKSPTLILSSLYSIGFYLFSPENADSLFHQNRLKPLLYQGTNTLSFKQTLTGYYKFSSKIRQFCKYPNLIYFQFMNTSICGLSGYQKKQCQKNIQNLQDYWYEFKLIQVVIEVLKVVQNDQEFLIKMIMDCIMDSFDTPKIRNYFLSSQRILAYCLLTYSRGNLEKLLDHKFLDKIGMGITEKACSFANDTLFSMGEVFHIYFLCLSNFSNGILNGTQFGIYTFDTMPSLISLDLFLFKFCCRILSKAGSSLNKFLAPFLKSAQKICYQGNLQIGRMRSFCSMLALLMEVSLTDFFTLTMLTELGNHTRETTEQFYGCLLASVQPIKLADFVSGVSVFTRETRFFDEFLEKFTIQEGNKISLKPQYHNVFKPFNLKYLKSKSLNRNFKQIFLNNKQSSFNSYPLRLFPESVDLKDFLFNKELIERSVTMAKQTLSIESNNQELLENSLGDVANLFEELIKIFFLTNSNEVRDFFQELLCSKTQFKLPQELRQQLFIISGKKLEMKEESSTASRRIKMLQVKSKKLLKMKEKSNIFMENNREKVVNQIEEEETQRSEQNCIICKLNLKEEPLGYMSLMRKTNFFSKYYLNMQSSVFCLSSCNHLIHIKCSHQINNPQQFKFCSYCSSGSNLLIFNNSKLNQLDFMSSLDQVQVMATILNQNENDVLGKYGSEEVDELSIPQKLVESIGISLLQCIFWDPQFYFRQQHRIHHSLLKLLSNKTNNFCLLKQKINKQIQESLHPTDLNQQSIKNIEEEQNTIKGRIFSIQQMWIAYKFIIQNIILLIRGEKQEEKKNEDWNIDILAKKMVPNLLNKIVEVIAFLGKELKEEEIQELSKRQPLEQLILTHLPSSLTELGKQMGKCPNCSEFAHDLAKCLVCDFKSCTGCKVRGLQEHAIKSHGGCSIFVRVDDGKPIQIAMNNKSTSKITLYQNYFGSNFDRSLSNNKQKYFLNLKSLNLLRRKIIRNSIEVQLLQPKK